MEPSKYPQRSCLWYPIELIGHHAMRRVYMLVALVELIVRSFWFARIHKKTRRPYVIKKILEQVYLIAIKRSLLAILALGVISGCLVVGFVSPQLVIFGEQDVMGQAIVLLIALELAPLLISIVMISRSATVICSELAIKRLRGDIDDASNAVYGDWVYPRIIGGLISVACLTFCFVHVAYISGYIMLFFIQNMPVLMYIDLVSDAMQTFSHWMVLTLKVVLDAVLIFTFACLGGLQAKKKDQGVADANAFVVRYCFSYVMFFNAAISVSYYTLAVLLNWDVL